jgi:hypothetical protein
LHTLEDSQKRQIAEGIAQLVGGESSKADIFALIKELSKKMIVILRDMQTEIGLQMIKPVENPCLRHFEVVSLNEFTRKIEKEQETFKRVIDLFKGIDFSDIKDDITNITDERYRSVIQMYVTIVLILQYFKGRKLTKEYVQHFYIKKAISPTCYRPVNALMSSGPVC